MSHPSAWRAIITVASLLLATHSWAQAAAPAPRLALKGYDPVAYFVDGKPRKGDATYRHDFDEARYHFASPRNRDLFAADPERYAPRFAGYCTGSMSRGVKNEGDPEIWVIEGGRLYVFGSGKGDAEGKERGRQGIARLKADPAGVTDKAQRHWNALH